MPFLCYLLLSAEVTDISIMLPKETSRATEWQFLEHLQPVCYKRSNNLVSVALTVANLIEQKMVFIHNFLGFGPVICLSVLWCEIMLFAVFACELFQKLHKAWCSCYTTDLLWLWFLVIITPLKPSPSAHHKFENLKSFRRKQYNFSAYS